MHAPYHPWVEALPVGGLYVARFLTPDSVFRIRGRMVAAAAECCSRPFGGSCASGSDVIRGDPACMADHGEAVRVQRRRRRHAHRDRARPKVVRCASPQKSVTDLQASSCSVLLPTRSQSSYLILSARAFLPAEPEAQNMISMCHSKNVPFRPSIEF